MNIIEAAQLVQDFEKDSLTDQISAIETILQGANAEKFSASFHLIGIDAALLDAALTMKSVAREINVVIHAVGILLAVPRILDNDETIVSLSLGAGSTGKSFDLETTRRVADFKFIQWRGGSEAIRQNSLFKDFLLAFRARNREAQRALCHRDRTPDEVSQRWPSSGERDESKSRFVGRLQFAL